MYWVGIEGKVLKVEHTKAFEHNKESHLLSRGRLMVMMVCVRERMSDTLLGYQRSKFPGKSQGHATRVNLEHFALFYTAPGIEGDSSFIVT